MTSKSRATLNSEADTNLADNTTRAVSEGDIRQSVKDLADSTVNLNDDLTTITNYREKTTGKIIDTNGAWGSMAEVTLTDAATIAVDLAAGFDFAVTLGANRTLGNATNVQVGQRGRIRVVQDATGSRTLSFASNYEFRSQTAPTLTTTANAEDILYYDCISATRILILMAEDIG